jgi:hypothetical protein
MKIKELIKKDIGLITYLFILGIGLFYMGIIHNHIFLYWLLGFIILIIYYFNLEYKKLSL